MTDLVEFLRARLAEDAEHARAAGAGKWSVQTVEGDTAVMFDSEQEPVLWDDEALTPEKMLHIARHHPARVLREVEAKRELIDWYEMIIKINRRDSDIERESTQGGTLKLVLLNLAVAYTGHPDYQPEWAPTA